MPESTLFLLQTTKVRHPRNSPQETLKFSRNMWADILERHLNDRRRNDYHRSDIGKQLL